MEKTMHSEITYEEIDKWARSWAPRGYYYRKIHPTYGVLALVINNQGLKKLFIYDNSLKTLAWYLGTFKGHNSKELFDSFILAMKKDEYWREHSDYFLGLFDGYGLPVETKEPVKAKKVGRPRKKDSVKPKEIENKAFSTPVEAKPSPTNSDVPHFKTVVAHNYEESKPQIEQRESEHKEASNIKEVKVGKPFLISLLEYFFKK